MKIRESEVEGLGGLGRKLQIFSYRQLQTRWVIVNCRKLNITEEREGRKINTRRGRFPTWCMVTVTTKGMG